MSLKLILYLIAISGIFKKDNDLDILPPPPPFPEIGMDDKAEEEELKRKEKEETRKEKELKERRKEFKKEIREKELEKKRILREKISKKKHNSRKKQVFNFFHSLGLVKTEKEKKEIELQREKRKEFEKSRMEMREKELIKRKELELKEQEAKRKEDEEKRRKAGEERKQVEIDEQKKKDLEIKKKEKEEWEKQKDIARQQKETERKNKKELERQQKEDKEKNIKEEKLEIEKDKSKKRPFLGIFGKKTSDLELEKELKEIEEIKPETSILKAETSDFAELADIGQDIKKPEEVKEAEEEIQKAIQGMKVKKKPSIVRSLFKKKEKPKKIIEKPEVMPRTFDKIDHFGLIEEKIHKARL